MKSYLTTLLITLLITTQTTSNCTKGCLRCGETQNCLFCDYTEFYFSKGTTCEKSEKQNCQQISQSGDCVNCNQGYYLDKTTKNCILLEKPLINCDRHTSESICSFCKSGFYLEGFSCLKIPDVIENCSDYNGKSKCMFCEMGFELLSDGSGCVRSPSTRNCGIFSNFKCHTCQDGFFFNKNYYIDLYFKGNVNENLTSFMESVKFGGGDKFVPSGCEKVNVDNCEIVETADKCKECKKGFFLKADKNCEKNPFVPIVNCEIYFNHLICLKCSNGFWLENPKSCKAINPIDNCSNYDQTVESLCLNCSTGFFLQTNTCNERSANVNNCESYFNNQDDCQQCLPGYILTDDKKKCLKEISNCISYAANDKSTTELKCNECTNKNYINIIENTCLPGEIGNCQEYFNSPTICSSCSNLFYLENNHCIAHKSLTACENYSLIHKDTCTSCISDHILFTRKNHCIANTEISFCASYSNSYTCSSCQDGYFLQSNLCIEIAIENCLQRNIHNECIKCNKGYYIENGLCHLYYDYQTQNCLEKKDDGFNSQNNLNCSQCQSFNFPKSYLNHFVCIQETRLIKDSLKKTNCLKHKLIGNTSSCDQCASGYYIDETTGDCTNTCSGTKIEYRYVGTGSPYNIDEDPRKKLCVSAVQGCEIQSMDTFGDMQCLKCAADYVPTYLKRVALKNIDGSYGEAEESQGVSYPTFTCVAKASHTFNDLALTVMPVDCLVFKLDNTQWLCQQCKFGKTGEVKESNSKFYVECDQVVEGCNDDYYGGFHFEDYDSVFDLSSSLAFNCHSCYQPNHIPVSFAIGSDVVAPAGATQNVNGWLYKGLTPFNLDNTEIPKDSVSKVGKLTQCLQINTTDLTFAAIDFTATFTPNCAMAYVHVGRAKNFKNGASDAEISLKCAECLPGFKKIVEIPNQTSFLSGCVEILNCNNDHHLKWINSCSKCMTGYSWKWETANKRIRYDECLDNLGDDNCMAISDQSPQFCKYCNKDYILNLDGKCEKLKVPKTIEGKYYEILKDLDVSNAFYREMYLIEYLNPDGLGSTQCETGYFPFLRLNYENTACTGSSYLTKKIFRSNTTTNFVRHCKDYYGNELSPIKCKKCQDNYIPNITNTKCLSQTNFLNCAIVNISNTFCETCIPTYTLRKNICERALIKNCVSYDPNANFQKCNLCEEGYFVSSDTKSCILGLINNCKIYNNSGNCTVCEASYGLADLANNRESCIFLKEELKCDAIEIVSFINHEYRCVSCKEGHSLTQDVGLYDPTVCLPINPISNCQEHDVKSTLNASTLACNKCIETFYSFENGLQCQPRDLFVENCVKMADDAQTCSECQPLYYLSVDKKTCLEYPVGVFNCAKYKSKSVCETCKPGYYLKDKLCVLVKTEEIIKNCAEYSYENTTFTCARCKTHFFRETPTTCIVSLAQNCLTAETKSKCKTCPEGYIFKNTETTTDCVQQTIPNCLHLDPVSKNCLTCIKEFYPNNLGKCSAVPKSILNCILYSTIDKCLTCNNQTFLSLDQKSCISKGHNGFNLMENCEKTSYDNQSYCMACKEGHYFVEGTCESCLNGVEEGCFACDSSDNTTCLICKSGFYQEEFKGECKANVVIVDKEEEVEGERGFVFLVFYVLGVLLF